MPVLYVTGANEWFDTNLDLDLGLRPCYGFETFLDSIKINTIQYLRIRTRIQIRRQSK